MFFNPLLPDSSLSRPTTHRNRYREQRYQRQKRHLLLFERLEQRWLLAGDPFVLNIVPEPDSPLRTSSVNIDVKFSEPVQGVDADDMLLIGTAAASATVGTPVDLGSDTWRFPVAGLAEGMLNVSLAPDSGDIQDLEGNPLAHAVWSHVVALAGPVTEGFETGDFSALPWKFDGDSAWTVTSTYKHSGTYSAQVGPFVGISVLEVTLDTSEGDVSFWSRYVSGGMNDRSYVSFYIDGEEIDWFGFSTPWENCTYPVTAGTHTFAWEYVGSPPDPWEGGSNGTYLIDDLVFPPPEPVPTGEIFGTVWNDLNGDGQQSLGESGLAGWTVFLDTNESGQIDDEIVGTRSRDANLPIPYEADPKPSLMTSSLEVIGIDATITDLDVTLNLEHTWMGDLLGYLTSPSGTVVTLFKHVGEDGDGFLGTRFDDEASMSIGEGSAPFTGSFRPESPLAAVDGERPNGTWHLELWDWWGEDEGTLLDWSLTITTLDGTHTRDSGSLNTPIPDAEFWMTSTLMVSGIDAPIVDLDVTLDIAHPRCVDLEVHLISPSGTWVPLFWNVGGDGANFTNTTFDDEAAIGIGDGSPPFSGTFQPFEPLSALDGEFPDGLWSLQIHDWNQENEGVLLSWSLTITTDGDIYTPSTGTIELPIPDFQIVSITSNLPVVGIEAPITDVDVTLNIEHTYVEDLEVHLISPMGTRVKLFAYVGGDGQNFVNTTLDDEATRRIGSSYTSTPFTGRFRPEGLLSTFDGELADGIWQVEIWDHWSDDSGTLLSWSLTITASEPQTQTSDEPGREGEYVFAGLRTGTYPVSYILPAEWEHTVPVTGIHPVSLVDGQVATKVDFGARLDPRPVVDRLFPADDSVGAAIDTDLVVFFDKAVQKGTGEIFVRRTADHSVVDTIDVTTTAVNISGKMATIATAVPLDHATGYYVEIDEGTFQDFEGNRFAGISGSSTWDFVTATADQPVLIVGHHQLAPDEPNQVVPIFVAGDLLVSGLTVRAQLGDGTGPLVEPTFSGVDFTSGIWDAHPNSVTGGPLAGNAQFLESSVVFTQSGTEVTCHGRIVNLVIDTTGLFQPSTFDLRLANTEIGADTAFVLSGGIPAEIAITNGTVTIGSGVVGRHVFYNQSWFDGNDPAAGPSDDDAIAEDRQALRPGGVATFANYTSYQRGINGVMVDITGLADPAALDSGSFEFRMGNTDSPENWELAPLPSDVSVRVGAGVGGSDRVTLIWANNAIEKQWLQVTVKVDTTTGLLVPDVFYFGNAVGESGDSTGNTFVDGFDFAAARDNPRSFLDRSPIDFPFDYNRDSLVDGFDMAIARDHHTNFQTSLILLDLSSTAQGASLGFAEFGFQKHDDGFVASPSGIFAHEPETHFLSSGLSSEPQVLEPQETSTVTIDVGNHVLLPNTSDQWIAINVSSSDPVNSPLVSGMNVRMQIGDGTGPDNEPDIQTIDFSGGIWDAFPSSLIPTDAADHVIDSKYVFGSIVFNDLGAHVTPDGVILKAKVSTVGAPSTTYPLTMRNSSDIGDDTYFILTGPVRYDPVIVNGSVIVNAPPVLADVPTEATIPELALYTFTATATDADIPVQPLTFSLVDAPDGAAIDAATGEFTWTPSEAQGPGQFIFGVRVSDGVANTEQTVTIVVTEVNEPRIDMTIVHQPSATEDNGEVATLPERADWVHDWQSFWVEIWVSTPDSTEVGVAEAKVDLQYHSGYLTAQEIVYGPAWEHPAILIDEQANFVTLHGWTERTDVGDDAYVLLARVRFTSTGEDDVPVDEAGGNIGPYDMQLALAEGQTRLMGAGELAAAELGAAPETEFWAVVYDIDDNHQIDFGDFSFFAAAFGQTAGPPSSQAPFTWWADFDKTGRVDFGDLAFFAPNFNKTRAAVQAGEQTLVFPGNFPDAWRPAVGGGGEGEWQGQLLGGGPTLLPVSGTDGLARPTMLPMADRATTVTDDAFAQLGGQGIERWTTPSRTGVERSPERFEVPGRRPRLGARWEPFENLLTLLAEQLPDGRPHGGD